MTLWQRLCQAIRNWFAAPSLREQFEMTLEFPEPDDTRVVDPFGKFIEAREKEDSNGG